MSKALMDFFNKQPRLGTLSTADKAGNVNAAYFGSPHMPDERTIVMGCGQNRTLQNLKENPKGCFLIMEPGATPPEWKGVRVYVKMSGADETGEKLERMRAFIAEKVGEETARKMIHAALTFEITDIRPLLDMGQNWENSI